MNSAQIVAVSGIPFDSKGKPINLTVITLSDGRRLLRGLKPFITDLKNSGRLLNVNVNTITSVNDSDIQKEYTALRKGSAGQCGTVTGDYFDVKEGEEYEDENPKSATYGKPVAYKTDHTRINGFLELTINAEHKQMEMNSDAEINFKAKLMGMFGSNVVAIEEEVDADDIPQDLLDQLETETAEADAVAETVVVKDKK